MNYKNILILSFVLILVPTVSAINSNSKFDENNKTLFITDPKTNMILLTIQQLSVNPELVTTEEIFKITAFEDYKFNNLKDFKVRWQKFKGNKDVTKVKWEVLETVQYNTTVPYFNVFKRNITISNIQSYTNITDSYYIKPRRLDWGVNAKEKWDITSAIGNGIIGFDRYEIISKNPLNIKFFWNATERTESRQVSEYRNEWRPFIPEGKTIKKNKSYTVKLSLYKQAEKG